MPEWAAVPPGGSYRVDIATGKSQARWNNPPGPETVVDKRKLPKTSGCGPRDADDGLQKPGSNGAAPPDRLEADQADVQQQAGDQLDLEREAELRFQGYLEDRSLFPKPMRREAFSRLSLEGASI